MSHSQVLVSIVGIAALGCLPVDGGAMDASDLHAATLGVYVVGTDGKAPPRKIVDIDTAAEPYTEIWLDVDQVAAIEAHFGPGDGVHEFRASTGDERWPLEADAAGPDMIARLDCTTEFKEAWQTEGVLRLRYDEPGRTRTITLRARPEVVRPTQGEATTFTVAQRTTEIVPGSNGYVRVKLGDITGGRVSVEMTTAEGETLLDRGLMSLHDRRTFVLGDDRYSVEIVKMVNLLIGKDWADLEIRRRSAAEKATEREKIDGLLERMAASDATFIREGIDYDGAHAAAHLRDKYTIARDQVGTLDEFIERIGSRSSTTGRPYYVRFSDGTTIDAEAWLRQQARFLEPGDVTEE